MTTSRNNPRNTRSTRSSRSPLNASSRRTAGIVVLVLMLCMFGVFLVTGADPLGLFAGATETPAPGQEGPVAQPDTVQPPEPGSQPNENPGTAWWRVYFTDPASIHDPNNLAGSIPEKLIQLIQDARQSIHIASFEFNLTPVAEALIAARKRGVEVQFVTDDDNGLGADQEPGRGQFAMLKKAGIKVKTDNRAPFMHDKFWIFDQEIVWTGSTNITVNDNFRNNNNVIVIDSPEIARIYEREFAEMWAGKFGPTSPSTVNDQSVTIDGTPIQVLFASEDKVISHLIPLVQGAKTSIIFMAFSFTHDQLTQAMLERASAGVKVQGIFETRGSETEYSALIPMYCAKLPVRQDGNPGTFHHKVIVIDGKTVITGSLNFTDNADTGNDENTLVIQNKEIASLYQKEFQRRWAEAVEPDASKMNCK